jgi:hypothetical protein
MANAEERLVALRSALDSTSPHRRTLGLRSCAAALSTYGGHRFVGPEHQGLRPAIQFWQPKTYGELFDAYRAVWNMVLEVSRGWDREERMRANSVLIQVATGLIRIENLKEMIFYTLEKLVEDDANDVREMVKFVTTNLRFHKERLEPESIARIEYLKQALEGTSYASRLRRTVLFSDWGELRLKDEKGEDPLQAKVETLAEEGAKNPETLFPVLPELVKDVGVKLFDFGYALGRHDKNRVFLDWILDLQKKAGKSGMSQLLSGYLGFLSESEEAVWESSLERVMSDNELIHLTGDLIWRTEVNNKILIKMIEELKRGRMSAESFRSLAYVGTPEKIKTENLVEGINELLKADKKGAGIALEITYGWYCHEKTSTALPEDVISQVLTDKTVLLNLSDGSGDWYWQEIEQQYIKRNPKHIFELFGNVVESLRHVGHGFLGLRDGLRSALADIINTDPKQCWQVISSEHNKEDNLGRGVVELLEPGVSFGEDELFGLISLFPAANVMEWISQNPEERAPIIAGMAPKTLNSETSGGKLTRDLLAQYGDMKSVSNELLAHFHTGGWSGPASEHYRRKRDTAREWLAGESSPRVRVWIERYVEMLTQEIESAEMEEERRY